MVHRPTRHVVLDPCQLYLLECLHKRDGCRLHNGKLVHDQVWICHVSWSRKATDLNTPTGTRMILWEAAVISYSKLILTRLLGFG